KRADGHRPLGRHQVAVRSLHRADRAGREARGCAGELDRGPPGAPARVVERHGSRRLPRAGGEEGRHRRRDALQVARQRRRLHPQPRARMLVSPNGQLRRPIRLPAPRGRRVRGDDEQEPHRAQPRLCVRPSLLRNRGDDGPPGRRARSRSRRDPPAKSDSAGADAVPHADRRLLRQRRLSRRAGQSRAGRRLRGLATPAGQGARKLRAKLVDYAAHLMERPAADLEFRDGAVRPRSGKGPSYSVKDLAGRAHWNTESLPDGMEPGLQATAVFGFGVSRAVDAEDRVNSSNTYGFIAEIMAVEVDRRTAAIKILRYVTVHDAGTIINPMIAEGQIYGGALHGLGGALYEELQYDEDGQCLTGSFMDYLVPTASEAPTIEIAHVAS